MRKLILVAALTAFGCNNPPTPSDGGTVTHTLTVQKTGTGTGTVSGGGLDCGTACSKAVDQDTVVTLTAAPTSGSQVGTWTGCDSSTSTTCTVTMNADRTVGVEFTQSQVVLISANITTPTTWYTGTIYEVTKAITVSAPLTIQPGVLVRFDAGASLTTLTGGTINADGQSASNPIIFTSAKPSPTGGDWGGITLKANGSVFSFCQVLFAGANEQAALAIEANTSATITNCAFAHHRTPTDSIDAAPALDASSAAAGTVIKNNIFFDNRVPLALNVTFSADLNAFDNSAAAPGNPQPNKYNAVVITGCGHITSTINWPALTVPYVIGDSHTACNYVQVDAAGQLTLGAAGANAVVKFFGSGSFDVHGTLTAHAIFTSIKDDTHLGDTNADGTVTNPAAADWDGVSVAKNGSTFDQCSFLYAGNGNQPALALGTFVTTVTNSTFAHHHPAETKVVAAPALDASDAASGTVITGNTFYDTTVPISWNTSFSINDTNTFTGADPGGATKGNTYQAIVVRGCGHVTADITWSVTKVPLLIGDPVTACNYVQIDSGAHLTIADQVMVKFFPSGSVSASGTLTANATTGIVFTAWSDDAHGGDTNADGAASAPAAGDWDGISLSTSGSSFNHCTVLYAGGKTTGGNSAAIGIASGKTVSVTNSVIAHTATSTDSLRATPALDVTGAATGTVVTNNRIFDSTVPLGINANLSLDDSNVFNSGVVGSLQANKYDGVMVDGCGHVTSNTQWSATKIPFVIGNAVDACNYLVVDGAGHLTLGPNVTLKFFLSGEIDVSIGGTLTVDSTDWLTCIKDDHLTDTNADGNATTPATGDWSGIKHSHQGTSPTCDEAAYMWWYTPNNADHSCSW